ncbi:MAG TPA: Crp/Fnr family transcriptional regulator [Xanthomonadaceae bacterium]|nr:Crp/Fnr family transcriptional regulator [Xanthomonadaceae bacterium]
MGKKNPPAAGRASGASPERPAAAATGDARLASDAPRRNRILAALPEADYQRLLPALEPFPLPQGWAVHGAGRRQTHLYFITRGVVSRSCLTEEGKGVEFSTTGSEGVVGVTLCLGGGSTSSQAEVIVEGFSFRLAADLLLRELGAHGPLMELLLRYTQSLMDEAGQIGACSRHHSLQHRLCRWLLSLHDRSDDERLPVTHDTIAQMLGVRREGVTQAVGKLHAQGLIDCQRGHIDMLDREGLEAQACECYAVIRQAHECLAEAGGSQRLLRRSR